MFFNFYLKLVICKFYYMGFKKGQKGKFFIIDIYCSNCQQHLYKYQKEGPGSLVKCYCNRIKKDFCQQDMVCPICNTQFARKIRIHNRDANKIIKGKVFIKGHIKK